MRKFRSIRCKLFFEKKSNQNQNQSKLKKVTHHFVIYMITQ